MKTILKTITILVLLLCNHKEANATIIISEPVLLSGGSYNSTSKTFLTCETEHIYFSYTCSSTINEELEIDLSNINIASLSPSGTFNVWQIPSESSPYTLEVVIMFTSLNFNVWGNGIVNGFNIGIKSESENATINFNLHLPKGVLSTTKNEICANVTQEIELSVYSNTNEAILDPSSIIWTGPTNTQISTPGESSTTVLIGALNQFESVTFTCIGNYLPNPVNGSICSFITTITIAANYSGHEITQNISTCDSLTWIDGVTYYASNNNSSYTLQNINGCDSVVHLNLTINNSPAIAVTPDLFSCNYYVLPSLNYGNYYTLPNAGGTMLNEGDTIQTSQQLFIYATNNECVSENSFDVTISENPENILINIDNSLVTNATNVFYQWIKCDNPILILDGETNQSFFPSIDGSYAVIISNDVCTSDTSECITFSTLELYTTPDEMHSIHPNPFLDALTIKTEKPLFIEIFNVTGNIIWSDNIYTTTPIPLNNLTSGTYILKASDGTKIHYHNIVKF